MKIIGPIFIAIYIFIWWYSIKTIFERLGIGLITIITILTLANTITIAGVASEIGNQWILYAYIGLPFILSICCAIFNFKKEKNQNQAVELTDKSLRDCQ